MIVKGAQSTPTQPSSKNSPPPENTAQPAQPEQMYYGGLQNKPFGRSPRVGAIGTGTAVSPMQGTLRRGGLADALQGAQAKLQAMTAEQSEPQQQIADLPQHDPEGTARPNENKYAASREGNPWCGPRFNKK